jgi:hypothetical protein
MAPLVRRRRHPSPAALSPSSTRSRVRINSPVVASQYLLLSSIGLTAHERREVRGELFRQGHHRFVDEHRHDADVPAERRACFDANEVLGIVQPALARAVGGEPSGPDDDDQHLARPHGALDRVDEIEAGSMPSTSMNTRSAPKWPARRS